MRLSEIEDLPCDKKNLIEPAFIFLTRLKKILAGGRGSEIIKG